MSTTTTNRAARATIAAAGGLLLAVAAPVAASAHVTVDPTAAEPGSFTVVTVKVPNESATAGTDQVRVELPTDTPFAYVSYVPVAGWTAELERETLPEPVDVDGNEITEAVTSITWTADAGADLTDGQLQLFPISVGPVPDTGSIVLPTTQTYTDGDVVEWTETEADAEYPAPVLYVNDAPVSHEDGDAHEDADPDATVSGNGDGTASASAASAATTSAATDDVLARVLGVGGLVVGAVGIALAVTARRRTAA